MFAYISGDHVANDTNAAVADTVNIVSVDLSPISSKFTRTGSTTKIDNGFSALEVSVKDCGAGTCNDSNSWNFGLNSKTSKSVQITATMNFSLNGIDATFANIKNITFALGGCWHGGGGESCGDESNPDFTSTGGKASIRVWDGSAGSAKWEALGGNIGLGSSSSSSADAYADYTRTKSTNFKEGHIVNNQISINIKTWGTTVKDFKIIEVIDYAKLNVVYEIPAIDINSILIADAGNDQRVQENSNVILDASASIDPDGDTLSFYWTQISGASVVLENSDQQVANFVASEVETYETLKFRVNVTDQNSYDLDDVTVFVRNETLNQPNIIIFFTDDQRSDTIEGMPTVMSRIAGEGALFTNAYVNLAYCCPSRATLLTGQYAHNHDIWDNKAPLGGASKLDDSSTVGTWMQAAGYRTGYMGKYLNEYNLLFPKPAQGWDTWNVIKLMYYYKWAMSVNGDVIYGDNLPEFYLTDVLRDRAISFMQNDTGQPFFLIVAFPAPHKDNASPYPRVAPRHEGSCDDLPAWRPPNYNETDISDKPSFMGYLDPLDEADMVYIDTFRREQICSLKAVDEAVGAVMDALGPQLDNTLIIFTSDNGYFWGEHRKEGKWELYEEALHVPFAIRYPPLISGPQIRDELISNVDIAATVSDVAYAPPTPYIKIDGKSLLELFKEGDPNWRTHLLVEQIRHGNQAGVRTEGYHYIESLKDGVIYYELYDMVNDPYQLENVASNSTYATKMDELHQILVDLRDD